VSSGSSLHSSRSSSLPPPSYAAQAAAQRPSARSQVQATRTAAGCGVVAGDVSTDALLQLLLGPAVDGELLLQSPTRTAPPAALPLRAPAATPAGGTAAAAGGDDEAAGMLIDGPIMPQGQGLAAVGSFRLEDMLV
jgi:hypothetical protein